MKARLANRPVSYPPPHCRILEGPQPASRVRAPMNRPLPTPYTLLAVLLLVTAGAVHAQKPIIQGVYDLQLGMSPEQARAAMTGDERFQRIAGREFQGFPLFQTTLGEHRLRVRPTFTEGRLVKIALRFRETASPNEVDPIITGQLRFARDALSRRFGAPDRTPIPLEGLDRRDFRRGESLVSQAWQRGERYARIMLWREDFTHGAEIVLTEEAPSDPAQDAAEAF